MQEAFCSICRGDHPTENHSEKAIDNMAEIPDSRIVSDVYDIDEDELYLKVGDYWEASSDFWDEMKNKQYFFLTEKQKSWLLKIENTLNREINR